ncbi:zinc ABC transporter permease AztB [Nocardia sp. NBC_00881]|uniref:zinc ABC transporter permease AztB n=1 Tax=Nocardia sp. NBC_00881 TaxID=2975995 RepID=UPI0038708ACD|nr:zinc ABC transporter permease AztB [Nocardia sp. NBC_00881]
MDWLFAPYEVAFVQRAMWGGLLVSCVCALAGTWVVVRGMAFLGDAMAHGMLPGVAVASLLGGNLLLGAAISCAAMAFGVSVLGRNRRFAPDTAIGLLFVGMLATGVIIVSRSQSFAVDLTGFLFGDVLAVRERDLGYLAAALVVAAAVAILGHRAFVALTFDPRKAHTLGLRPKAAHAVLVGLVTLAIVASFHIVGTLLVFGLLIAPPAAAMYWSSRIPVIMLVAAALGSLSTFAGLWISWHADIAAGATIAAVAVATFFVSAVASALRDRVRSAGAGAGAMLMVVLAALPLLGCGAGGGDAPVTEETTHGYVAGAEETAEPQTRLVVADGSTGAVRVIDLITEAVIKADQVQGARHIAGDGRFAYLGAADSVRVVDSGAWIVDHGDHVHYYRAQVRTVGALPGAEVSDAHSDPMIAAVGIDNGGTILLDRGSLDAGSIIERGRVDRGAAVPYAEHLVVATPDRVEVRTRDGAVAATATEPCPDPRGHAVTRRGLAIGCADGALVLARRDGAFGTEKIPYPRGMGGRATEFTHRPGSTTLTALAGSDGVWVLDIRKKTWTRVPIADAVAVNTAGEGSALLVLTRDGTLHALDAGTGRQTAQVALLAAPVGDRTLPVIEVDANRAYVNDPAGRAVHEIAYNDNLRSARTFPLDIAPTLMVETGR